MRSFTDNYSDTHPEYLNYTEREFDAYVVKISPKMEGPDDFSTKSSKILADLDSFEKLNYAFKNKKIQVHVQTIKNINLEL